jgi:hypothetical protein
MIITKLLPVKNFMYERFFSDVVRTDRSNPYFAGEGNENVEVMKNILLNYAYYNPGIR